MVARTDCFDDAEFIEWFNNRPVNVQEVIREYPPDRKYKLHGPFPVTIYAYEENKDGSVTLEVDVNSPILPRRVFGVKPESLKPFSEAREGARRVM